MMKDMENITDKTLLEEWNSILLHQLLFNTVILWVYCAVGIVGNTVVLFFYSFRIKGKLEDRFLIPHLAFFDLLATIFTTIDKTLDNIFPVMYPNHRLCQISNFTSRVFAATGDGVLLLIAFQRYYRICRPFQIQRPLPNDRVCLILIFLAAVVLNSPVFLFYDLHQVPHRDHDVIGYRCDHIHHNVQFSSMMAGYDIFVFILIVVAMVTIIVLYVFIARAIKRSAVNSKKQSTGKSPSSEVNQSNIKEITSETNECLFKSTADDKSEKSVNYTKRNSSVASLGKLASLTVALRNNYQTNRFSYMFMTIALLFIITYIPSNILKMCELHHPEMWIELPHWRLHVYLIFRQGYILNHVVNPFVYGLFDSGFRRDLVRSLKCSKT